VPIFIGLILPFLIYAALDSVGFDITQEVYILVVVALLGTSALIWSESLLALRRIDPPEPPDGVYPPASAIIAAYLPNEAATIEATIDAFLRLDYPGPLEIILAYNTPRDMPIEAVLQEIAQRDKRFIPLRVKNSTSKAQNVNAALAKVNGKFVGVFDADHHPDPDSFQRAWRWLASGYDIVQGHCLVRNGDSSWVARTVAVEFEAIYAVSHPGRARLHNFGIFGGSNGFWKTDLLRETRMHGFMLTEDIDSSFRVIRSGHKIASDPYLVSRELAPTRLRSLWTQRMRWAQGWFQVSLVQTMPLLRSPKLSLHQKLGVVHLLAWREFYPWLSWQMIPIVVYWAWSLGGFDRINWWIPLFVLTTIVTMSTGPLQLLFVYRLADGAIKQRRRWFWWYLLLSAFVYVEYKNEIARIAQVKEVMRERVWRATPRS
jgi:cellulose synthase/poly-beta-1,6-N-acetylglucosamine synthase-like glycosyltransferase